MTAIGDALSALRGERDRLTAELARLDSAIRTIEALESYAETGTGAAPTRDKTQRAAAMFELGVDLATGERGTRARIEEVFRAHPDRAFSVKELHTALLESGWQSQAGNSRNVVSVNIRRMLDRGQIERLAEGRYRLPNQSADVDVDFDRVREDQIRDDVQDDPTEQGWGSSEDERNYGTTR